MSIKRPTATQRKSPDQSKKTLAHSLTHDSRWLNLSVWLIMATIFVGIIVLALGSDISQPLPLIGILGLTISLIALARAVVVARKMSTQDNLDNQRDPLEIARERSRAIYELTITLSSTLDYNRVLEVAQNIGRLNIHQHSAEARIVSMVLLFRQDDDQLYVVSSKGLIRNDENNVTPGNSGILARVLKHAEAFIISHPDNDPELRRFVTFRKMRSVLAVPLHAGFENYGVLVFGSSEPNTFSDEYKEWLVAIGTQATVALQNAVLYESILLEKERIVNVEEEARKKLARDLHDGPTQTIAMIATRADIIRRMVKASQINQAHDELAKVEELARKTTKEIRHMLFTLRPLVLETQGLIPAITQLAEKMEDTHELSVIVQARVEIEHWLDDNQQGILFYVIEEAVNNAHKHAHASQVWVRMYPSNRFLIVEVQDDGVGFDVDSVINANYHERGSLGMVNMRERVELISGKFSLKSAPGRGTRISIQIPPGKHSPSAGHSSALTNDIKRGKNAPSPTQTRFGAKLREQ